jgi:dipeptidyl aminopeptidase/acylaminoacyl peptidase
MSGVDHAISEGLADPKRLGCYGHSYGGFLALWIVGHTDRFGAAVAENPVTDWVSNYGTSDAGPSVRPQQLGGKPHEKPDAYRRCSAITYAHNCTTPTLLIQSEQDFRCPPSQAEQYYAVLKSVGCKAEMLRLPKSTHVSTMRGTPPIRHAGNEALLEWMKRNL